MELLDDCAMTPRMAILFLKDIQKVYMLGSIWAGHYDFDAFSKMAQRENCMGSIWHIEMKFGADCQVHSVTFVNDYQSAKWIQS